MASINQYDAAHEVNEERRQFQSYITDPHLSFVTECGIHNFRGIGGYPIATNSGEGAGVVRTGFIFRSANLNTITPKGIYRLAKEFGIRDIFDLRSGEERSSSTKCGISASGITIHHLPAVDWKQCEVPIMKHFAWLSLDVTAAFLVIYERLCIECAPAYRVIFNHIKQHPERPILIHCDLGKDRTGIFVALLLKVLGVPDRVIADAYHQSEIEVVPLIASKTKRLLQNPILKDQPRAMEKHFFAPKEVMRSFLLRLQKLYGDGEGYLRFLGFNDADIKSIKQSLMESTAREHVKTW